MPTSTETKPKPKKRLTEIEVAEVSLVTFGANKKNKWPIAKSAEVAPATAAVSDPAAPVSASAAPPAAAAEPVSVTTTKAMPERGQPGGGCLCSKDGGPGCACKGTVNCACGCATKIAQKDAGEESTTTAADTAVVSTSAAAVAAEPPTKTEASAATVEVGKANVRATQQRLEHFAAMIDLVLTSVKTILGGLTSDTVSEPEKVAPAAPDADTSDPVVVESQKAALEQLPALVAKVAEQEAKLAEQSVMIAKLAAGSNNSVTTMRPTSNAQVVDGDVPRRGDDDCLMVITGGDTGALSRGRG